jgi:hypothetical protein
MLDVWCSFCAATRSWREPACTEHSPGSWLRDAFATLDPEADQSSRMRSAAIQAIAIVGAAVLPASCTGMTEASTTRSPVTPRTRSWGGTEDYGSASRAQKVYQADWQRREFLGHWIHSLADSSEGPLFGQWAQQPKSMKLRAACNLLRHPLFLPRKLWSASAPNPHCYC